MNADKRGSIKNEKVLLDARCLLFDQIRVHPR